MTEEEKKKLDERMKAGLSATPPPVSFEMESKKEEADPLGEMPKMSDYQWAQQTLGPLYETPLTEEERNRRERAAYISNGVANLGNAFGAFGNMLYAAHGAPAQTLPTTPDVDQKVNAFRDRADRVRQQYLTGRMALRQADLGEYNSAVKNQLARYNVDLNRQYKEMDLRIKQDRENRLRLKNYYDVMRQEALSRKDAAQAAYWEAKAAGVDSLTASQIEANLSRAAASRASAAKNAYQTGPMTEITTDGLTGSQNTKTRSYGGQPANASASAYTTSNAATSNSGRANASKNQSGKGSENRASTKNGGTGSWGKSINRGTKG